MPMSTQNKLETNRLMYFAEENRSQLHSRTCRLVPKYIYIIY